jgi:tetratricopeptide (TPR) repeat protein
MNKKVFANSRNKVLPFDQNGQFYYKKAQKFIDSNNYVDALSFYRKAVDKDPENVNYKMDLAQVFSEMNYYDESNRLLFLVLQKEKNKSECYFGLGCNFMALREYEKAEECFDRYLKMDSEGMYAEDVDDLLDLLRSTEYFTEEEFYIGSLSPAKEKLYKLANKGRELLDAGEYKKAIKCMEKVVKKDPVLVFVRNNLSLAYYCEGNTDKAVEMTKDILIEYPKNIHANCNLAIMLNDSGNETEVSELKRVILGFDTNDPDELHKIAVTLCELKLHKEANSALKELLQYRPYDVKLLHYYAVSWFNMKNFRESLFLWNRIEKILPENMISNYYKKLTQNYIKEDKEFKELGYHFQVPYEEIIFRVRKINDLLKLSIEDLKQKWERNDWTQGLFVWSLSLNDNLMKKGILNAVASMKDSKAEYFLRDFSLRRNVDDDLKKEALMLLSQMGAKEPYMAYMNDNVVEIRVNSTVLHENEAPAYYQEVVDIAMEGMKNKYKRGYETDIKRIWDQFVFTVKTESLPRIKKPEAWAAALELFYCSLNGLSVNKSGIAKRYNVSYSTLSNNFYTLMRVLGIAGMQFRL